MLVSSFTIALAAERYCDRSEATVVYFARMVRCHVRPSKLSAALSPPRTPPFHDVKAIIAVLLARADDVIK
jgi:hypothetical protein